MYVIFRERAEKMGLENKGNGCFLYTDKFGTVVYRDLVTRDGVGILDNVDTRYLGVWTSNTPNPDSEFSFIGAVSDKYQFVGNEAVVNQICNSIQEVGCPNFQENALFAPFKTQMRNEILVRNKFTMTEEGNIYPLIIVNNSYNGTKAVDVTFGIFIESMNNRYGNILFGFQEKLSKMRQVHLVDSRTTLTSVIGDYINDFSGGVSSIIDSNFREKIDVPDMMRVLGLIEKIGKRKKKEVAEYINKLQEMDKDEGKDDSLTTWKLFLAITRFSTMEKNLNVKSLLENVAESVLTVPVAMVRTVQALEKQE